MGTKLNLCGQCTRILFIILNFLFLIIGLALIAGGAYLIASGSNLSFLTGNGIASGAAIIIICGGVTLIITAIGLLGAFGLWRPLLVIYCIAVLVIVILQIVAGILGFVYRDTITATVSGRANAAIEEYTPNGDSGAAVDFMQRSFACCGWSNFSDWLGTSYYNSTQMIPGSCNCTDTQEGSGEGLCVTINFVPVYRRGCQSSVQSFFQDNLIAVGAIGVAIGLFEVVGILLGFILCIAVHKSTNSYTSV